MQADLPKKAGGGAARDDEVIARTHLGTGNRKNPIKLLANLTGQKLVFAEGAFEPNCVLYLRNCKECHFTVNVHSTKVLLEGLSGCYVELAGKVITSTAEAWKCQDTEILAKTKLAWQMDLSQKLRLQYQNAADFVQIVWAGMEEFSLELLDTKEHPKLEMGLTQMRQEFNGDVNAELDQFIVRIVDNKLLHERIVRLPNGFPTTDREADKFDAEAAKKDEHLRKMAAQLIKENPQLVSGPLKSKNQEQKIRTKVCKPNDKCHCNSGKKYKKCCQAKDEEEEKKKKLPERALRLPEPDKETVAASTKEVPTPEK